MVATLTGPTTDLPPGVATVDAQHGRVLVGLVGAARVSRAVLLNPGHDGHGPMHWGWSSFVGTSGSMEPPCRSATWPSPLSLRSAAHELGAALGTPEGRLRVIPQALSADWTCGSLKPPPGPPEGPPLGKPEGGEPDGVPEGMSLGLP